jgi:CRISPR system Cascade subunit CasB
MSGKTDRGVVIANWWSEHIADRASGRARALAARLRRAEGVEVLAEPEVHMLAAVLHLQQRDAARLVRLAQTLAGVRENSAQSLAQWLGGREKDDRAMSALRFQRLLRSREDEFATQVRRALAMVDRKCNVAALGLDLLRWDHPELGDEVRVRWSFGYFSASSARLESNTETQDLEISP